MSGQQLRELVKTAIRSLKGRKREQTAFAIAALCFSGGFAFGKVVPDLIPGQWVARFQIALYAIGTIALVYGIWWVRRLVNPPELPPVQNRPSAIKGLTPFTEADGELFRKLGRERELQKLLGFVLDDQILMVVVRGASGAGKTSLLRAGLKHILDDSAVFHYWEAVATEPDQRLLHAIQERWPEGATKPSTLAELINPSHTLGKQSHVVVLDQFEQLHGNQEIFQLLSRIISESKPPHRITWVISFRHEFTNDWLDFISPEQDRGFRLPQDVSLRLFTAEQAREVIGQLSSESDLKDSIEESVINNLVEAVTVGDKVSPVDIGIGLLMLTELHEQQSGQTITKRDYQFAGGAEGLLTQYISRCLERFRKEDQKAILKAMLALRDPEENQQRLSTGLTLNTLAAEAGTYAPVLELQLKHLADRNIRLLEVDISTDGSGVRYRLPHERLIPALYRLTGRLLAEVDQAKVKFQNAFQAWQINDKRSRYLLKGKDLRLVERYEMQIPWGDDEQVKKSFLLQSERRRQFVWAASVATMWALSGISFFSIRRYEQSQDQGYLTENGYPAELYDYQQQLKKLEMTEPLNLEHFPWLSSDFIEELSLKAETTSDSIAGLTSLSRCSSLKKLRLDLSKSQVRYLQPLTQLNGLKHLSLVLSKSLASDLQPLAELRGLTQLSLDLNDSAVTDLRPLAQLNGPTQFSLALTDSQVTDSKLLAQLKHPEQLSVVLLHGSQGDYLPSLAELNGITQLSLELSHSEVSNLQPLTQLQQLRQLTLNLSYSEVRDWEPLAQLNGLTQLSLDLSNSKVGNLQPLMQLQRLRQLTLNLSLSEVNIPPLAELNNLTQLTLDLRGDELDLQPLVQFKRLQQLTLDLRGSQLSDLQPLAQLKETELTLFLSGDQVSYLQPLSQLQRLYVKLYLHGSEMSYLDSVRNLSSLRTLSIKNAIRAQRMSLRSIPASVVELEF